MPSSSRKMPCSIDRMPARMAFLMPSVAWACAITKMPAAVASSTSTCSSAGRRCAWVGLSRGESTPPDVATLMTSAPCRTSVRTTRRISSGPSTRVSGRPGMREKMSASMPDGSQPSPCPPVWLIIRRLSWMRGPRISPSSRARRMPRSAPPASRTE